jgi:hypothetical protein
LDRAGAFWERAGAIRDDVSTLSKMTGKITDALGARSAEKYRAYNDED